MNNIFRSIWSVNSFLKREICVNTTTAGLAKKKRKPFMLSSTCSDEYDLSMFWLDEVVFCFVFCSYWQYLLTINNCAKHLEFSYNI